MKIRYLKTIDYPKLVSLLKVSSYGELIESPDKITLKDGNTDLSISKVTSMKRIKPRKMAIEEWIEVSFINEDNELEKIYLIGRGITGVGLEEIAGLFRNFFIKDFDFSTVKEKQVIAQSPFSNLKNSIPIKIPILLVAIVVWNLLFLSDRLELFKVNSNSFIGFGTVLALGLFFLFSILILISKRIQNFVLKPEKSFNDIKRSLYLILFITGIMFIGFSFRYFN
jgi:hypothetical protein